MSPKCIAYLLISWIELASARRKHSRINPKRIRINRIAHRHVSSETLIVTLRSEDAERTCKMFFAVLLLFFLGLEDGHCGHGALAIGLDGADGEGLCVGALEG